MIRDVGSVVGCGTLWGVPVVVADPLSAVLGLADACPDTVDSWLVSLLWSSSVADDESLSSPLASSLSPLGASA